LLPTGVIALRAAAGSADPAGIVPTTLFATICSTTVAIASAKLMQRFWHAPAAAATSASDDNLFGDGMDDLDTSPQRIDDGTVPVIEGADIPYPAWVSFVVLAGIFALIPLTVFYGRTIAPWIVPGLVVGLLGFGVARKVRVYEIFVEGAKDGFRVALRIIPYLVAILVAVAMFRASGAMDMVITPLSAITGPLGLPAEALPMALLRPLSGSGAYGILASLINDSAIGPDSYTGYLVSTLQGSTETTFYVLAVYFGAIGIRRIRHALAAGLCADIAGIVGAVVIVSLLYGAAG
jgi:spore maturation protein SpmB